MKGEEPFRPCGAQLVPDTSDGTARTVPGRRHEAGRHPERAQLLSGRDGEFRSLDLPGPHDENRNGPRNAEGPTAYSSYATTSSITTRIVRIAVLVNALPTTAKLSRTGPASRSDDTPPATDS